ncbi:hypothetical protein SODALDRAFT_362801 [Sodiomyces alkalinus F11]|uniref:Uncharacterized protein n=1 Tax=Sodiomyces alkalinus (strain CBS 110278 / VKM F-3762 / F11) TaxID=1314773 RepID=A0A3N2PN78_SODAK|nr:hypothetical protein SODALDRAFT_362801 [Sodiomyces alkalinus F11]ROT35943.1 hypothetical protein SODALDRAFT_362801 [Sodiomyces alkalinus F11]
MRHDTTLLASSAGGILENENCHFATATTETSMTTAKLQPAAFASLLSSWMQHPRTCARFALPPLRNLNTKPRLQILRHPHATAMTYAYTDGSSTLSSSIYLGSNAAENLSLTPFQVPLATLSGRQGTSLFATYLQNVKAPPETSLSTSG